MKNGFPTLMLIRAGGNDTMTYLGPTDLAALVDFVDLVNEEQRRTTSLFTPEKV